MKRLLKSLFVATVIMLVPTIVNAQEITTGTPSMSDATLNGKPVFEAKGTPIVIDEVDGETVITWEGGSYTLTNPSNTIVIGGYFNPCTTITDNDTCSINLTSASITMKGGSISRIMGGNLITSNYTNYSAVKSGNINISVTDATVGGIFGLTNGSTSLSSSYYNNIKEFYTADKISITIDNSEIGFIVSTSSYTYVNEYEVTVKNNSNITLDEYGLSMGSNGVISKATTNVIDSNVITINAGNRAMIESWTVNVSGNSIIGDIYAGAYYSPNYQADSWNKIGEVNYGQVGKMTFNLGEGVTYNNIYAGFQFVDKAKFLETYAGNAALETYAKGIDGSENAEVNITIASAPIVTDSEVVSMLDSTKENVTISYIVQTEDLSSIDTSAKVESPTIGFTDATKAEGILQEALKNNSTIILNITNGFNVSVVIIMEEIEALEDVQAKVEELLQEKSSDAIVATYFDISVLLKNKEFAEEIESISTLSQAIELSIVLPENLQKVEEGYTRTFYIVREHDGEYELIDAKLSDDGTYITFSTDKFSTYALAYVDTEKQTSDSVIESPKTGDNIAIYVSIGLISICGLGYLIKTKKLN